MFQPRRSVRSIQPLPSIYTAFSNNNNENKSNEHSGKCLIRRIEDGIEVVPFERDCSSAPILSPDQGEKEVFLASKQGLKPSEKPLPRLPQTLWGRMSVKQRIVAIICIQAGLLLTIGLSLMAAKQRSSENGRRLGVQSTDNISLQNSSMIPLTRGTFSVPIQGPQQQSSACLAKSNESIAWQCASDTSFQLNILPSSGTSNTTLITLGTLSKPNATIYHGQQAPEIRLVAVTPIKTVEGNEAYHFRTTYDRIVLLKESDLVSDGNLRTQPVMRQPSFVIGESLWRCTFNETVIEGFIYPNKSTIMDTTTPNNNTATAVPQLPIMPHAMKLVEQRMPNGKAPYCEKMMLRRDGKMTRLDTKKFMLGVVEPAAEVDAAEKELIKSRLFRKVRKRADAANYCSCQWMVQ